MWIDLRRKLNLNRGTKRNRLKSQKSLKMRSFGLTLLLSVNGDFYGTRRITKRAGDDTYGIFTPGVRTNGWFLIKVGSVFPTVISSEFRMEQYIHEDHREDATHFIITFSKLIFMNLTGLWRDLIKTASTIVNVVIQFRARLI